MEIIPLYLQISRTHSREPPSSISTIQQSYTNQGKPETICLGANADSPKKNSPPKRTISRVLLWLSPPTMRNRMLLWFSTRHKYVLVATILTLFIFLKSVPSSSLDPRADKYGEDRPRYLHQSKFRADPDYEYEVGLSNALRAMEIEREVHHEEDTTDTLWQIMLPGVSQRSEDSFQFEKKNPDWKYKVSLATKNSHLGNPIQVRAMVTNVRTYSLYKPTGLTNSSSRL